ncbi:RING/U-box superfamily protein [Euphorbia peplus]|nr:RING/U-box superfamily protein [Euphorbia peplus]
MAITSPSPSPSAQLHWISSPSPSPLAGVTTQTVKNLNLPPPPPVNSTNSKLPVDFSPTLIAMVVVVATAFLVITYSRLISRYLIRLLHRWRRWRRRRRRYLPSSNGDLDSPPPLFDSPEGFHLYSPYGLDESVIKTLPLFIYTAKNLSTKGAINNGKECAVCLLEFEDDDYVRTLPVCSHAFHVDCIDIWLRSHANCPLCRARIFRSESPFIPLMAARIRPSLDESILRNFTLEPPPPLPQAAAIQPEIIEEASPRRNSNNFNFNFNFNNYSQSEDRFILKRSYSFSFERSCTSERMLTLDPPTASPFRYRRGSFWNKRPSPFGSVSKSRVFSFRYYRGMKSPFRRKGGLFFPLSERQPGSSRRSKSTASTPMRSWAAGGGFSSSRLRCGDPEALLSPERYSRRDTWREGSGKGRES